MKKGNNCTISLGSNIADKKQQITNAVEHISGFLNDCTVSTVYETDALNGKDNSYLNAVLFGTTHCDYNTVVTFLKDLEAKQGRNQDDSNAGIIAVDLDLVIWNEQIKRPKDFERHYFNQGYRELLAKGIYETM